MVRRGVIDPRKNKLSSVIASLTDEELSAVFEEITDFKDSGILTKNSNLSRIARELHETFSVPYDLRMVEDDILYEAARLPEDSTMVMNLRNGSKIQDCCLDALLAESTVMML